MVYDDFKCHRDPAFTADLLNRANTVVILIPGTLNPPLQPLNRAFNKQMKRLMRAKYTAYTATTKADSKTGKLMPTGHGAVPT